jgi:hypothetical protein
LILSSHLHWGLLSDFFSWEFPARYLYTFLIATMHNRPSYKEYKLWSFSLCNFLHISPSGILNTCFQHTTQLNFMCVCIYR